MTSSGVFVSCDRQTKIIQKFIQEKIWKKNFTLPRREQYSFNVSKGEFAIHEVVYIQYIMHTSAHHNVVSKKGTQPDVFMLTFW